MNKENSLLPVKAIDWILESGMYFDDEFNLDQKKLILTDDSRSWFSDNLGILNLQSLFVDLYSFFVGGCGPRPEADPLFTLEEVIKSTESSFWSNEYPEISEKYLQLSSIEGEHSYFYSKTSDKVFSVTWGQMPEFISGEKEANFKTFADFVDWYFCI